MPDNKPHPLQIFLWAVTAAGILATGAWTLYTYVPPSKPSSDASVEAEPNESGAKTVDDVEALAMYDLETETEPPSLDGHKSVFQSILDSASQNPSLVTGKVLDIDLDRDYFITIKVKVDGADVASEWHFYKERYIPSLENVKHGDVLTVVGRLIAGGGSDLARCKPITLNGTDIFIDFR